MMLTILDPIRWYVRQYLEYRHRDTGGSQELTKYFAHTLGGKYIYTFGYENRFNDHLLRTSRR